MDEHIDVMLEIYKFNFNAGDQGAILKTLRMCFANKHKVPEWASREFCAAYQRISRMDANSWDDVFGSPHKGKKITNLRKEKDLRWDIFTRVIKLRKIKPKPKDIFQIVADEFRISRATCKRYFDNLRPPKLVQKRR